MAAPTLDDIATVVSSPGPTLADIAQVMPPEQPRSTLAEIATGAMRGAVVGLPRLAGQAMQYASDPGERVYEYGKGLAESAEKRGQKPSLTLQPEGRGMVTNALASGAEMLAPSLAPAVAIGMGTAAAGASPFLAGGAALVGMGTLFGAQQGQSTLDKAEKAGIDPNSEPAKTAARINAAQTFATEAAAGYLGGRLLGVFGKSMGQLFTKEAGPLAETTLKALTGRAGALKPLAKELPFTMAGEVGTEMVQEAGVAAVENAYGIDNAAPWESAKQVIGPTLGMTALLAPLGLVVRGAQVRSAQARTATLASGATSPEIRAQLAGEYANALQAVNPEAAGVFRQNANVAIQHKLNMVVDSKMFDPGTMAAPVSSEPTTSPGAAPPAVPGGAPAPPPAPFDPNWETSPGAAPPKPGNSVPFTREVDTTGIEVLELHTQIKDDLVAAGETPAVPLTRKEFAATEAGRELKGQELAKAHKAYLASPEALQDMMRKDAASHDALQARVAEQRAAEGAAADDAAPSKTAMAEAMTAAVKKRDEAVAFAARDANKPRELDAIANIAKGAQLADAAARGEVRPNPNAPRTPADLVTEWGAAMAANEMDTKAQARVPFEKKLAALGIDKMATHQEQIDALKGVVADKKTSQGMRDRVSMLVDKLEAEMPAAAQAAVDKSVGKPLEQVEAAAAKTDAQVAREPEGTLTGRQAVLDGLVQPDRPRVEVLEQLHVRAQEEAAALVASPDPVRAEALQTKLTHMASVERQAKALDDADAALGEPPVQAEALGTNIEPGAATIPGVAENIVPKPPKKGPMTLAEKRDRRAQRQAEKETEAAKLGDNEIAQGDAGITSVSEIADQTADKIAELRADFAQRMRAGEKLTPLEQERYDDLSGAARSIDKYTEGKGSPSDAGYVKFISQFVYEASEPYKKSRKGTAGVDDVLSHIVTDPSETNMGLLGPAAMSRQLTDVLRNFAANGTQPWVRDLAARLEKLLPDTTISPGGFRDAEDVAAGGRTHKQGVTGGEFSMTANHIDIWPRGASERTILHEATHAATAHNLQRGMDLVVGGKSPKNQNDARLMKAYRDISQLSLEVSEAAVTRKDAPFQGEGFLYGLKNEHEFVAELYTNREFQNFLRSVGDGPKNLWQRATDAVRRLLGMDAKYENALDRAMRISEEFMTPREINMAFDASPAGAAGASEIVLRRVIAAADSDRTPFSKMNDALFSAALPAKTLGYIAHQIRGIPELVATGFSRSVDAYQQATVSQRVVGNYMRRAGSAYIDGATRVLRAVGDSDKAREVQREMAVIGMEASRLGFDYRKNGKDNIAQDANLSAADKPHIDDIHRRFTQLQKQYPDAANVLQEGERMNRTILLDTVATLAANTMDTRAGVARRLATELERMDPADAKRAELESRVRAATLESTFADKYAKGLDFMEPSLRTAKNSRPEFFYDGAAAAIYGRLAEMFKAAKALPDGTPLRTHLGALENLYSAQVGKPYFSLGREGDYFVKVGFKGIDAATNARIQAALKGLDMVVGDLTRGDDHAFFRVENADAARALHDRLVLAGEGKVVDTAWGLQTEKLNAVSGVAPALRTLLGSLDDMVAHTPGMSSEHSAAMRETLTRQILSMLPETASRSASMGRRGIPGYSTNFVTSFARRGEAAVHDIAGAYTARAYAQATQMRTDALEQINRTGSAQARLRAGAVNNELTKRFADTMKPVENTHVAQATSISHSFYLGASPAYFIRTMAQPYLRGLPYIGSKFGFAASLVEMGRATPVATQVISNSLRAAVAKDGARGLLGAPIELQGLNLPAHEMAFINELYLRGELDLGQSGQLLHAAMRPGSQKTQDVLRTVALTARMAEMSNRLIMGLAAYRLAHNRPGLLGRDTPTATEYAIRAIDRGMDNFDPSNTDRFTSRHGFAGPITPLFTQFQKFALQTMEQIARTVHDGFFGQDKSPEGLLRAKEAKREFAGLMATTGMMAGALGLPFANAFAGIYNNLMSDEDDPQDVRIAIRNWATLSFGKEVGDVLMKGPGTLLGYDTATFGLQGVLPGSDFLASRMAFKERADAQMISMLGPAVSLGADLITGASKIADGYWLKGIEAMLPIGLRTFFKTAELARVGYTDSKGNPLPLEAGASDIAWRALGFQTAAKADQGDASRDHYMNQQLLARRRGQITDQYLKSLDDPAALADAGQAMQAFNLKNPTQPITGQAIRGALRERLTRNALGMASGTGVPVSRRQFPALVENERFAAMPGR